MKLQKNYVAPQSEALEVVTENVLCISGEFSPEVSTEDATYKDLEW